MIRPALMAGTSRPAGQASKRGGEGAMGKRQLRGRVFSPGGERGGGGGWLGGAIPPARRAAEAEFVVEPKMDGLTVVLTYERGVFSQGTTRGDGETGEDVTANLRTVRNLPLRIPVEEGGPAAPRRLVVRGEAYIPVADFEAMNERLRQAEERTFLNPRNAAAGALRQLDPSLTATRPIRFLAYAIVEGDQSAPKTQWDVLQCLRGLGFSVAELARLCHDLDEAIAYAQEGAERRASFPFEAGGMVLKINDLALAAALGGVGKHPPGARAL